jgi:hypothetical protein
MQTKRSKQLGQGMTDSIINSESLYSCGFRAFSV